MFEPFIEDDEPFDRYCKSMRKNGRWGGHLEIQAASMLYRVNILIYQLALPRYTVDSIPVNSKPHSVSDGMLLTFRVAKTSL